MGSQLLFERLVWALMALMVVNLSGTAYSRSIYLQERAASGASPTAAAGSLGRHSTHAGAATATAAALPHGLATIRHHHHSLRRLTGEGPQQRRSAAAAVATAAPAAATAAGSDAATAVPPLSVCINFNIVYVGTPQLGAYLFTNATCTAVQPQISHDLAALAASYGAVVAAPFATATCGPQQVAVCGQLVAGAAAAEALGGQLLLLLGLWLEAALGPGGLCAPKWMGSQFVVEVAVSGGGPLQQAYSPVCDLFVDDSTLPTHTCNHKPFATPFAVGKAVETYNTSDGLSVGHCFSIRTVTPTNPKLLCGKTKALQKVELFAREELRRNLTAVRLRGAAQGGGDTPLSSSWGPAGTNLLRITKLNMDLATAGVQPQICLELSAGLSLTDFCAGDYQRCFLWLYDRGLKCCPMYAAA